MYTLNDKEMFYDIEDGQAVVINFSTGVYFGTSRIGSEVLDRILKGYSVDCILSALKKAPGCPSDIAETLNRFVEDLKEKSIIVEGETVTGGDGAFDDDLFAEGFGMSVTEHDEVQDLLLADPVHDVDEDVGWPALKK